MTRNSTAELTRRLAPSAAILAVLVLVTSVFTGSWARPALGALELSRHQDRYTGIAFVESITPLLSMPAGSGFTLTVRVGNHQGSVTGYELTTTLADKSGSALGAPQSATFDLADSATIDLPVTVTLPACTGRIRVDVSLTGRPEALRAWLNLQSADPEVKACA